MANARYTMLLDEHAVLTTNQLQAALGLSTRAAVFDLALVVLDWFVRQKQEDRQVGSMAADSFKEVLLPVMVRPAVPAAAANPATASARQPDYGDEAVATRAAADALAKAA